MTTSAAWVDPDRRVLSRSPLVNVIWQVRLTGLPDVTDGQVALDLQRALDRPTNLSKINPSRVSLPIPGPGGAQLAEQPSPKATVEGWRLSSSNGSIHLSIQPDSLSIETAEYQGWSNQFEAWVHAAVHGLVRVGPPRVLLRVGMRYINAIFGSALDRDPFADVTELDDLVAPALLGFLSDPQLAPAVEGLQARQVLKIGTTTSHIQHGSIKTDSGELGLLLDIDSYVEKTEEFALDDVLSISNDLHLTCLAVFQRCLTPSAWHAMGPLDDGQI